MRIGALLSGGKDSLFALYLMKQKKHDISCVMTMKPVSDESYMFHYPNIDLVKTQAKLMDIPYIENTTKGEKEKELSDLEALIKEAKEKYNFDGICTGAINSNYQKSRIDAIAGKLELKSFAPLWERDPESLLKEMFDSNFEIIITNVAAEGLDESYLGKNLKDVFEHLKELNQKYALHMAGEGGEYETLVLYCPLFSKKISVLESKKITDKKTGSAMLLIEKIAQNE
ncbi:MAG: diphthine--ammonia ligase [Candidatus Aenigmarchaeota archaeon]|nr:diphthine--ammonia ligase [Candidatus Aenigmarchaeota archaeon]